MLYTKLINKAVLIAYDAHHGDCDPAGLPYVLHPVHVAEQMTDEITTVVALLHDVIRYTYLTADDLREEGLPECVLEAVELLTYQPSGSYEEYIAKIKENPVARAVKIADLRHNLDETRYDGCENRLSEQQRDYLIARRTRALEELTKPTGKED